MRNHQLITIHTALLPQAFSYSVLAFLDPVSQLVSFWPFKQIIYLHITLFHWPHNL